MVEITYRSVEGGSNDVRHPTDSDEALSWLDEGNRLFASLGTEAEPGSGENSSLVIEADFGFGAVRGEAPRQHPFGVVLGCADARVPIELVFGRAVNDLFVVRIAGNSVGADAVGSINYAVHHFPSVRVAVVLGHSQCGAVSAAAEAFLMPRAFLDLADSLPLRSLLDRILTAVRAAAKALEAVHGANAHGLPGYKAALTDVAVAINAAYAAYNLRAELVQQSGSHVQVVWGIYDLATRRAGIPGTVTAPLGPPPADAEQFRQLAWALASSQRTLDLLGK
ncbi:MAG: carbonic anhydrase [Thermoanaerobaculia bacterium]|jgi:carbonic anhydrase